MKYIVEFFINLVYFACFISIGQLFFDFKRKYIKYEKLILIAMVVMATAAWFFAEMWIKSIIHLASIVIILRLFFKEMWRKLVALYLGGMAILSMLTPIFEIIVFRLMELLQLVIKEKQVNLFAQLLLFVYINAIGRYYRKKHPNGLNRIGSKYWVLFVIMILVDSFMVATLENTIADTIQTNRASFLFFYISVVLSILIQLVLLINTLITRNIYKENVELAKQFLDKQKEHYEYLEKRERETKKFRHDIKNHLMILENLLNNNDQEQAKQYLNTMNDQVNAFGTHISVNNGIADAILNKFYAEAQEKGVEIVVNGHFPMECYISAYDICTILSNLLSNSILAEYQCGGERIKIDIRYVSDEVIFIIENDYNHELIIENGEFKSTKKDAYNHGLGLGNVRDCVEKGGGHMSISTENNRFKVKLIMKNEQKEIE